MVNKPSRISSSPCIALIARLENSTLAPKVSDLVVSDDELRESIGGKQLAKMK